MKISRLVFAGLYSDTNLGDPIIAQSTEWLFKQFTSLAKQPVRLDLFPTISICTRIRRKLKRTIHSSWSLSDYENSLDKHYAKYIQENDVIVAVGGGLIKYKYQDFYLALIHLLKVAHEKNAVVVFNSVGVEGYDELSPKCQHLKQAMLEAVRTQNLLYISTRDDILTLRDKYFDGKPKIPCIKVADPAVWCADAFQITRRADSNTIGVGIIRENIFIDNELPYSGNELFNLYVDTIKELKKQFHKVTLFTNGTLSDNQFAQDIQQTLREEEQIECELILPSSPEKLIYTISSFKGIIAGRLHSCIIAYSLNIPAIGLVWNDKLTLFGENIGLKENFITHDKFSPSYIVNQFQAAMQKGYNQDIAQTFKQTIKESIQEITQLYLN